jgi:hypothetical protein
VRPLFAVCRTLLVFAILFQRNSPTNIVWSAAADAGEGVAAAADTASYQTALDEMLRGSKGIVQYWTSAPELVILSSVMDYRGDSGRESIATDERIADEEADLLEADLTEALRMLTSGTYQQFSSVRREIVPAGKRTTLARARQIVAGRYANLRSTRGVIGFGGRTARSDGRITAGAILLDRDFDRINDRRRLLRMHELGHALGYNHVQAQTSIMNPAIGSEPTPFDRFAIQIAFDRAPKPATN